MLRVGVVGVGHLGRFHAEKYKTMTGVELTGVVDISHRRADLVADRLGVPSFYQAEKLIGLVDAVSLAVPTQDHYVVARAFLAAGIHVLLEKPIGRTLEEADALIDLARRNDLVLQVGHLERFNPAMLAVASLTAAPLFVEANRISPYPERGTDVDVVLDLMIHDIDITLSLVGAEPAAIHAVGVPVLTTRVDIANARLEFETGCVANLTASRISVKSQRKIRIFQRDAYLSIDYGEHQVDVVRRTPPDESGLPGIRMERLAVPTIDALEAELRSFVETVSNGGRPLVGGEEGRRALAVALQISNKITARQGDWFEVPARDSF